MANVCYMQLSGAVSWVLQGNEEKVCQTWTHKARIVASFASREDHGISKRKVPSNSSGEHYSPWFCPQVQLHHIYQRKRVLMGPACITSAYLSLNSFSPRQHSSKPTVYYKYCATITSATLTASWLQYQHPWPGTKLAGPCSFAGAELLLLKTAHRAVKNHEAIPSLTHTATLV